jgi:hypothetical protein
MGWYTNKLKRRPSFVGQPLAVRLAARREERKVLRKARLEAVLDARRTAKDVWTPSTSTVTTSNLSREPVSGLKARPHVGYASERSAYKARKAELLRSNPAAFVVFVGEEMAGPFHDFRSALRGGLRRFGPGPLYIKQVLAEEPASYSGAAESCLS